MKPIFILLALLIAGADEKAIVINWSADDVAGTRVQVPANDRVSVVAFVRGEQAQSTQALSRIRSVVNDASDVRVIVVVNGERATDHAKTFAASKDCAGCAIVVDPEFTSSGKFDVHVWPTTVIVDRAGVRIAHLAGLPQSFDPDLPLYLARARGTIDQATLQQRLGHHETVTETPKAVANVHLRTAQQLIDSGQFGQARTQIAEGLKANPNDGPLQVAMARVQLLLGRPLDAITLLDQLNPDAAPAWQLATLRGRALLALEKWPDAKTVLNDALKLNPNPAEVHYLLGVLYQHDSDWQKAAESFRKAYESTDAGKRAAVK